MKHSINMSIIFDEEFMENSNEESIEISILYIAKQNLIQFCLDRLPLENQDVVAEAPWELLEGNIEYIINDMPIRQNGKTGYFVYASVDFIIAFAIISSVLNSFTGGHKPGSEYMSGLSMSADLLAIDLLEG